ncbi:MAG: sterol desaturase family protein [Acidimicrobiia bacterium]
MTSASALIAWFIENSVPLLFVSVITLVVGDTTLRLLRRADLDLGAMATSIAAGFAYIMAKGVVSKLVMFGVSMWVYNNCRIWDFDNTVPLVWLAMFVCRDFVYYWIHRAEHQVKVLWASHMVHHSSEQFTFTTAVRMPWMEALYKPFLALWAPLIGFHPVAFAAMGALVLVAGQFQHTELLARRTPLDLLFVTPSAHRVHHGSNELYLDKNFGSMLIIWDRVFGTYQAETETVRFGLVGDKQVRTPAGAVRGGYPDLIASARQMSTTSGRLGVLLSAP